MNKMNLRGLFENTGSYANMTPRQQNHVQRTDASPAARAAKTTPTKTKLELSLEDAQSKVTIDMLNNIENGEEIQLNEDFTLYYYLEDELLTINHTETWTEITAVMYGVNNETVEFEELEDINNI